MKKYTGISNVVFNIILYTLCFLTPLSLMYRISDLLLGAYVEDSNILFLIVFMGGLLVSLLIGHRLYHFLGKLQRLGR